MFWLFLVGMPLTFSLAWGLKMALPDMSASLYGLAGLHGGSAVGAISICWIGLLLLGGQVNPVQPLIAALVPQTIWLIVDAARYTISRFSAAAARDTDAPSQ